VLLKQSGGKRLKQPKKGYDHVLDAFRFVMILMDNMGPLEEPPDPITAAEVWEHMQRESLFGPLREHLRVGAQREEEWKRRGSFRP
jgi:hypothetical protein